MKSERTGEIPFALEVTFDSEKWSTHMLRAIRDKLPSQYKKESFELLKFINRQDKNEIENLKKALFQKSISNDSFVLENKLQQKIMNMKKELGPIPSKKKKNQLEKAIDEHNKIKKYNLINLKNLDSNINNKIYSLTTKFTKYMNGTYPKIDIKSYHQNKNEVMKTKKMTQSSNLLVHLLFLDDYNWRKMSGYFIYTPTTVLKCDLLQFIATYLYLTRTNNSNKQTNKQKQKQKQDVSYCYCYTR